MHILWISYALWTNYSYSIITRRILPCLLAAGHQVTIATFWHHTGLRMNYTLGEHTVSVYGFNGPPEAFSEVALLPLWKMLKPDLCILCADCWRIAPEISKQIPLVLWMPVHHKPENQTTLECCQAARSVCVYSAWGTAVLKDQGIQARHIPVPADPAAFRPGDRAGARRFFGIRENEYLVTMVGINHPTDAKGFAHALVAFEAFARKHPARLYLHTNVSGGIDVFGIANALGISDRLITPDQAELSLNLYDEDFMARLYNASDLVLNTSRWEGYCMPLVEAQLCGVPVAAPIGHAAEELVIDGWTIPSHPYWCEHTKTWGVECDPSVVCVSLERAHTERDLERPDAREVFSRLAPEHIWSHYWQPMLAEMEGLL